MTDDWLSNGLPVFFGGSNKNEARSLLSRIGGPSGFKTAKTTLPDGSVMTVQTKGTMPPQVWINKVSAAAPVVTVRNYIGEEYMGYFADHDAYSFADGWYAGTTTISAKTLGVSSGLVVSSTAIDQYTWNDEYHRDRRWVSPGGDVYSTHSSGGWPYHIAGCHSFRVSDLPWYEYSGTPKAVKEGGADPYLLSRYSPQYGASPVITATCSDGNPHTVLLSYNLGPSIGGVDVSTGDEFVVWDKGSADHLSPMNTYATTAPTASGALLAAILFEEVKGGSGDGVYGVYSVVSTTGDYTCLSKETFSSHSSVTGNGTWVSAGTSSCVVRSSSEMALDRPIGGVISGESILPVILHATASSSGSYEGLWVGMWSMVSHSSSAQFNDSWSVVCGSLTICGSSQVFSCNENDDGTSCSARESSVLYPFIMPESGIVAVVVVKRSYAAFSSAQTLAPTVSVGLHVADVWKSRVYSYALPGRVFSPSEGYYVESNPAPSLPYGSYFNTTEGASASRTITSDIENGVTTSNDSCPSPSSVDVRDLVGAGASSSVSVFIEDLSIPSAIGTRDRPFGAVFGDEHVALISIRSPISNTDYINVSIDRSTGTANTFDYGTWYQLFYSAQVQT